jgi:hypothetical protein
VQQDRKYEIIAQIIGKDGTNTTRITLSYKALSVWPGLPDDNGANGLGAPNTGSHLYIGGYAVPVAGFLFWLAILIILGVGFWFVVIRRRKRAVEKQ